MNFSRFSNYLQQLETTSSRLEMTAQLAELFQELDPKEIPQACYLMQGSLVPNYKSLEFGISEKLTMRAIARLLAKNSTNNSIPTTNLFNEQDDSLYQNKIEQRFKKTGDLGIAVEELLQQANHKTSKQPSILEVHQLLSSIAEQEGEGSQDRKIVQTLKLLEKLDPTSAKFVARIIIGKLRLGFSTMTIIDALSWIKHQNKSDNSKIENAYQKKADIGKLAQGYLAASSTEQANQFLQDYQVEVGIPVIPALCQRLNSAQEIIEKMDQVIAEPKYDGLRAQVHVNKKDKKHPYQVFTRNLDNVTHMFPELESALANIQAESCILDTEAIAYDKKTGKLQSFQETITRKRKHDIKDQLEKTPIRFYVFDALFVDGQSLLNNSLKQRKQKLGEIIKDSETIAQTEFINTQDPDELRKYHEKQLGLGLEGAVIKKIDAEYKSGRKGWRWVKIKETEGTQGKLHDTLDLVVMGYYRGQGKRQQFGIGAFLVGVITDENEVKTVAKIGTGLTDDQFKQIKQMADKEKVATKPQQYKTPKDLKPDVWIAPSIVVEIAADEITTSPIHTAGKGLRFPRLVRFRNDKGWDQATNIEELEIIADAS